MFILDLPAEVFWVIIDHLSKKDLLALMMTSKVHHKHLLAPLYQREALETPFPLFWCAERGFANGVRVMLCLGAEVDARDPFEQTSLMLAAKCGIEPMKRLGYTSLEETMISKTAFDAAASVGDATQIHHGTSQSFARTEKGYEEVVKVLLEHGADINAKDYFEEDTPLRLAVRWANVGVAELLLRHDHSMVQSESQFLMSIFLDLKDAPRRQPLLKLLLNYGLDIDTPDSEGRSALHIACERGLDTSLIQLLLGHNANPNHRDSSNSTPLHTKVTVEAARLLLDYGADVNSQTPLGQTPLHCHIQHAELAELLVQWQANDTIADVWGRTPDEYNKEHHPLFVKERFRQFRNSLSKFCRRASGFIRAAWP